jgi:hypothetical protein
LESCAAGRVWLFHVSIDAVSRGGSTPEAMEMFNEDSLEPVRKNIAWRALVMFARLGSLGRQ